MTATPKPPGIPKPAHPQRRREPLPWQRPTPPSDEANAPANLERILRSEGSCRADDEVDFLNSGETPVRDRRIAPSSS